MSWPTDPHGFLLEGDYNDLRPISYFYEAEFFDFAPGGPQPVEAERLTYAFACGVEGWSITVGDGYFHNRPVLDAFWKEAAAIRLQLCRWLTGLGGGGPQLWFEEHPELQSWWNANFYLWPNGVFHPNRKKEEEEGVTFP